MLWLSRTYGGSFLPGQQTLIRQESVCDTQLLGPKTVSECLKPCSEGSKWKNFLGGGGGGGGACCQTPLGPMPTRIFPPKPTILDRTLVMIFPVGTNVAASLQTYSRCSHLQSSCWRTEAPGGCLTCWLPKWELWNKKLGHLIILTRGILKQLEIAAGKTHRL